MADAGLGWRKMGLEWRWNIRSAGSPVGERIDPFRKDESQTCGFHRLPEAMNVRAAEE
jgi:hypothetical protein